MLDTFDLQMYGLWFLRVDVRYGSMDSEFEVSQILAFAGLAIWGVGIPVLGALLISRHRLYVQSKRVKSLYGAVYEGFRIPTLDPRAKASEIKKHLQAQPNYFGHPAVHHFRCESFV